MFSVMKMVKGTIPSLMPTFNVLLPVDTTSLFLQNYGEFYDLKPVGLVGGQVHFVSNGNVMLDMSNNTWSYKVRH